jgi:hypothetical protein
MASTPLDGVVPDHATPTSTSPMRRGRARYFGVGAALAGVVLAVAIVLVATGGAGPIPTAAAAESVRHAVDATFRSDTLGFELTASVSAEGQDIQLTGSGSCILKLPECNLTLNDDEPLGNGSTIGTLHEVVTPTTSYVEMPASIASLLSKPWVSQPTDVSFQSSESSIGGSPLGAIAALAHEEGAAVSPLGTSVVDGVTTKEYLVQLSPADLVRKVSTTFAALPAWMRAKVGTPSFSAETAHVYVTDEGQVAQVQLSTSFSERGVTAQVSESERITSLHTTVTIHVPPASDVMPLSEFYSELGSIG